MWQVIRTSKQDCTLSSNPVLVLRRQGVLGGRVELLEAWTMDHEFGMQVRAIFLGHTHRATSRVYKVSMPIHVSLRICGGLQPTRVFSSYNRSRAISNGAGQRPTRLLICQFSLWPCHGVKPCACTILGSVADGWSSYLRYSSNTHHTTSYPNKRTAVQFVLYHSFIFLKQTLVPLRERLIRSKSHVWHQGCVNWTDMSVGGQACQIIYFFWWRRGKIHICAGENENQSVFIRVVYSPAILRDT